MKLHIPLGLRKAVCALALISPLATAADYVVDSDSSVTITASVLKTNSYPIAFTNDSASETNGFQIDGTTVVNVMQYPFVLNMKPLDDNGTLLSESVIEYNGVWLIDLSATWPFDDPVNLDKKVIIKPDADAPSNFRLSLLSTRGTSWADPCNNVAILSAAQGTLDMAVPRLFVDSRLGTNSKGTADASLNAISASQNGCLKLGTETEVNASWTKENGGGIRFSALSACGYDAIKYDDDSIGAIITGTDFIFRNFSFTSVGEGDISVHGIYANMAYHNDMVNNGDGTVTICSSMYYLPSSITLEGNVCIEGNSGSSALSTDNGVAEFTGIYASECADITIKKDLQVHNVSLSGNAESSFTALRASTDAEVYVQGGVLISDNTLQGEGGAIYSILADGGLVDLSPSDKARVIEGDMRASVGGLYKLYSDEERRPILVSREEEILAWTFGTQVYEAGGCINAAFANSDDAVSGFSGFTQDGDAVDDELGADADYAISEINLSFTNGAVWNVVPSNKPTELANGTYESRLTSLEADNAHIYVGTQASDWVAGSGGPSFSAGFERLKATDKPVVLTIASLSGTGSTFYLRADVEQDKADCVVVTGQASGEHRLMVQAGGQNGKEAMNAALVQAVPGAAFTLANPGEKVEAGVYLYELSEREGAVAGTTEWYLKRAGGGAGGDGGNLAPTGEMVLGLSSSAVQTSLFLQNLSDLRGRLGENRAAAAAEADFYSGKGELQPAPRATHAYAQAIAGHDKAPGFGGHDFRNDFWGAKVGVIRRVTERWMLGAELNRVEGKQRLLRPTYLSKGESESVGALLSATWMGWRGKYCDIVLGLERYEQDMDTRMLDGTPVSGSLNSLSPSASVEFGRKILFGRNQQWFFEPQVQLAWYMAGGDDFTTNNGMQVERDDYHSLTGRVGAALGKQHLLRNGDALQWHVNAGVKHEFMGNPELVVNGETFEADSLGTRIYYGVGADWWLNSRSRFYGSIQREEGGDYKSELNARVGYSFGF